MNLIFRLVLLTLLGAVWLTACADNGGPAAPPLAEAGQPTLVFIYTDA